MDFCEHSGKLQRARRESHQRPLLFIQRHFLFNQKYALWSHVWHQRHRRHWSRAELAQLFRSLGNRSSAIMKAILKRFISIWFIKHISFLTPLSLGPCCPDTLSVEQMTQAMTNVVWTPAIGAHSYVTSLTSPRGHAKCHTMDTHCLMGCITCNTNYNVSLEAISLTGHKTQCNYHGFSSSEFKSCLLMLSCDMI